MTPVVLLELWISPRIFEKIKNGPNGILRGLRESDSWKILESKISWHCHFNVIFIFMASWSLLCFTTFCTVHRLCLGLKFLHFFTICLQVQKDLFSRFKNPQSTQYTQSVNGRFLSYIPSWWKNYPRLVRGGCTLHMHAHPLSLYLPSRTKLQCTLQLRGQIHSPYFILCLCGKIYKEGETDLTEMSRFCLPAIGLRKAFAVEHLPS